MIKQFKKIFYFPVAYYFKFWANIRLKRWQPKIVVVTGSSGKTTLLHLLEAQLGTRARYSHKANSAYGIAFDILSLMRKKLTPSEWTGLIIKAPFSALKKPPVEKIYVVEADCDRPGEGRFLAPWLRPEITIWLSVDRSHSQNFTSLVPGKFPRVESAIAYEFGYFPADTSQLVIVNGDNSFITNELKRVPTKTKIEKITSVGLTSYHPTATRTEFSSAREKFSVPALLPRDAYQTIQVAITLTHYLQLKFNPDFTNFIPPPGRSSIFRGIKNTTLLDSSYNATLAGMRVMLDLFKVYPAEKKWAVLGDILEQGTLERDEHERLAELIAPLKLECLILIGPRISAYTYPKLKALVPALAVEKFIMPREGLDYLEQKLKGNETILFKGARFLEGIIEHLLLDKRDTEKLCRREKIWQTRRRDWNL